MGFIKTAACACALTAAVSATVADASGTNEAIYVDQGVGSVRLGESSAAVRARLGAGRLLAVGFRRYRSGSLILTVGVDRRRSRVNSISTHNPQQPRSTGSRSTAASVASCRCCDVTVGTS